MASQRLVKRKILVGLPNLDGAVCDRASAISGATRGKVHHVPT
jgi:hypothetical protein